jgi:hypothetical protein
MVHNQNRILDECEIKYVDEVIMHKQKHPKYVYEFLNKVSDYKNTCDKASLPYENEIIREDKFIQGWAANLAMGVIPSKEKGSYERIADHMGIIPFMPCVMINISPNWKGQYGEDKITDKLMKKKFSSILETYLKASNRYSKYKYVLECGSDGNHLHAHAVAEINKGMEKSVQTHINKGNHAIEIRKIWDKEMPKGKQGYLKGKYSIQRIMLRNEDLVKDKLNYLIEEKKPEGHKNKEDLGILVSVGF